MDRINTVKQFSLLVMVFTVVAFIGGCSGKFVVSGSITGLASDGLVLQNNNADSIAVPAGATSFSFPTTILDNTAYNVTIMGQPRGELCTFVPGTSNGKISGAAVNSVRIQCVPVAGPLFTVSGSVTGLTGTGLVLRDESTGVLPVAAGATTFTLVQGLPVGAFYNISVGTQPVGQTCSVANASGQITGPANVSNVAVTCVNNFTVGGTITGLATTADSRLVLQNNNGDTLSLPTGTTTFTFPIGVADGTGFNVTVVGQPNGELCTFVPNTNSGTIAGAAVTSVVLACVPIAGPLFTVSGTVTGLTGTGLVLQDDGQDDLAVAAAATTMTFATGLPVGAFYNVTVSTQPVGQTCTVANASGQITGTNIANVSVTCVDNFFIGGTITGLTTAGLVLQNNNGDNLTVPANATAFTFPIPVADGGTYAVTIVAQPAGNTCNFVGATSSGTVAGAEVASVQIACTTP